MFILVVLCPLNPHFNKYPAIRSTIPIKLVPSKNTDIINQLIDLNLYFIFSLISMKYYKRTQNVHLAFLDLSVFVCAGSPEPI